MQATNPARFPWCLELDSLYSVQTIVGRSGKRFEAKGSLSTSNNIELLRSIMMDCKPIKSLEVGMGFGGSALTIASCHKALGHTDPNSHTAIDLAQSSYWDNVAVDGLQRAGLTQLVRTIEQPSANALASLSENGERFDLCYVDGSHQFEDVFVDFYFIGRMLNVGGVVLFDDSSDAHVAKVLQFIRSNFEGVFEEFDLNQYVADSKQKLRRRIGRLVGSVQLVAFSKIKDGSASLRFQKF